MKRFTHTAKTTATNKTATLTTTALVAAAASALPATALADHHANSGSMNSDNRQQANANNSANAVANAVEREIESDPLVSPSNIDINSANPNTVTLTGTVDTLYDKHRAEDLASTVRAVHTVNNNISVDPVEVRDQSLRRDVQQTLLINPATESIDVEVAVTDGAVKLTGEVESAAERRLTRELVASLAGVKSIDASGLSLDPSYNRSDAEIASETIQAIIWDETVDSALIDVDVNDNIVTLSGAVGSRAEKLGAIDAAYDAGAQLVRAAGLDVASERSRTQFQEDQYANATDRDTTRAVARAIELDPDVVGVAIEVSYDDGTAELDGTVPNLNQKYLAGAIADRTLGVRRVDNDITVEVPGEPSPNDIEGNIRESFERNALIDHREIKIEVDGNTAELTGEVDSAVERAMVMSAAASSIGVRELDTAISVDDPVVLTTFDPYVDPVALAYVTDEPVISENLTPMKRDWEIAEDVQSELFWSPFVDSDNITVVVDDGIATLTGSVRTPGEANAAVENAYEGGAVIVDDELDVEYGPDDNDRR